jgi:uncharacterized protein
METTASDPSAERPLPPMTIAQSIVAVLVAVAAMIVSALALLLKPMFGREATLLIYYSLGMGLAVVLACRIRRLPLECSSFDLRVPPVSTWLPLALGSVGLLLGVVAPVTSLLPMSEESAERLAELAGQKGVASLLVFVVAAPVLEEMLFRGVILDGLLRVYSARTAILVSSLLFGIIHMNSIQFVTGTILGAFAGWVYYRSRSLLACVLIHMAANGTGFILRLCWDTAEAAREQPPLVESYGGVAPMVAILTVCTLAAVGSVWFLHRHWRVTDPASHWPSRHRRIRSARTTAPPNP